MITNDENNLLGKPTSLLTMMLKTRKGDTHKSSRISTSSQQTNSDPSWLYPILLPSTFTTLFALYAEHYSEDDHRLAKLMTELSRRDDEELCIALDLEWYIRHPVYRIVHACGEYMLAGSGCFCVGLIILFIRHHTIISVIRGQKSGSLYSSL